MKTSPHSPPNLLLKLLLWTCPPSLHESIEGDLLEKFDEECETKGVAAARRRFVIHVVGFLRPSILLRHKLSFELNQLNMFTSYLKIMLRLAMKRKTHSVISVAGLGVGITFALFIGAFIFLESEVNKDLKDVDRLFIIESTRKEDPTAFPFFCPSPLTKAAGETYPALIESYYRFWDRMITVSKNDKHFRIQSMIGDSTFFKTFGLTPLYGDPLTALQEPNSIVITKEIALLYFERADVVGETLTLATEQSGRKDYVVTAILPDLDKNIVTDFMNMDARIFLSLKNAGEFSLGDPDAWGAGQIISYLKLRPGIAASEISPVLQEVVREHAPEVITNGVTLEPVSLATYYLNANNGAIRKLLTTLSVIAAFILVLAVINYINMTIGSSVIRLKEIGVRKVIGGVRNHIVFQFLSESILVTIVAGALAMCGYVLLKGVFDDVFATQLPEISALPFAFWKWFIISLITIGVVAGLYPAIFLSASRTLESLKGKFRSLSKGVAVSKILITAQFVVATFIFICAIVLNRQVSYFTEKDLGYDHSYVVTVSSVPRLWNEEGLNRMEAAKKEFLTSSKIKSVSLSWEIPTGNYAGTVNIYTPESGIEKAVNIPVIRVDESYAEVYGIKILDGKFFFDENGKWQPQTIVLNETAQRSLGVSVGDKVKIADAGSLEFTVTGIVRDFNFFSLHSEMKPMIIFHTNENQVFRHLSFKVEGDLSSSVHEMELLWKKVFPDDPFDFKFMDESLASLYKTEIQLKKASNIATVLMLIIIFTGVLGLVSLMVSQRTKEIGIRKVLGATVTNILVMLNREYAMLLGIAFVIVVPASMLITREWLAGYAYHIELEWWMFLAPITIVFILTVLIISAQSLRTSMTNPSKTLKYE